MLGMSGMAQRPKPIDFVVSAIVARIRERDTKPENQLAARLRRGDDRFTVAADALRELTRVAKES
jgi:hypothetical protein